MFYIIFLQRGSSLVASRVIAERKARPALAPFLILGEDPEPFVPFRFALSVAYYESTQKVVRYL